MSDNDTEFAGHEEVAKIINADFYFCRPYWSSDRELNEKTNGLIKRFLPKGTDFNEVSNEAITKIGHILNTRGIDFLMIFFRVFDGGLRYSTCAFQRTEDAAIRLSIKLPLPRHRECSIWDIFFSLSKTISMINCFLNIG